MSDPTFDDATSALEGGRADTAVALFESLADHGVVGAGVAFDRGLAYAARAHTGQGVTGDFGRAVHAFEEALRRSPNDREAARALEIVRREIARREVAGGAKAEEVGAPPMWRALVTAAPADAWMAIALLSSLALSVALAVRPRVQRGLRLAASTTAIVGFFVAVLASALGFGASYLRRNVREAVVVVPGLVAKPMGSGDPLRLVEGTRVDVLEERMSEAHVRTDRGEGWLPRSALRTLPPYRP